MNSTAAIVWHAFLQSLPSELQNNLNQCVTSDLLGEIQSTAPSSALLKEGILPPEHELAQIHYSWFAPFLRSLPKNEIKIFLSCLTAEQIKGLKETLLLSNQIPEPTELGGAFLRKTLYSAISKEDLTPISCLPNDPLNGLLHLSYSELLSLIHLLSMHDLSVEVRHIIETAKLREIYSILTKAQSTFLKTLIHKKEAVTFKKMGLVNWKGDRESLKGILLQRGINRIAKALYNCHPDLLWHVVHRLDSEKAHMLMKLCTALDHPRAAPLLTDQVLELIQAIKSHNPPEAT